MNIAGKAKNIWKLPRWLGQCLPGSSAPPAGRRRARSTPLHVERLEDRAVPATLTVNSLLDNTAANGLLSLRQAIGAVDAGSFAGLDAGALAQIDTTNPFGTSDTIQFAPSLFTGGAQTLSMSLGEFLLSKSVSIQGPGATELTLDAQDNSRIFDIANSATTAMPLNATVTLEGMTLTNGRLTATGVQGAGGAIRSLISATGSLTVANCTITNSSVLGASESGGGISVSNSITVTNCILSNNFAANGGGAISANQGTKTITDCTITDNQATNEGGGINTGSGTIMLTNCQISDNTATGSGGINDSGATLLMVNCQVTGNSATGANGGGGGIGLGGVNATVENSTISGNSSEGAGGGISYNSITQGTTLTIENSTILGNYTLGANSPGGGLYLTDDNSFTMNFVVPSLIVENSLIAGNYTAGAGSSGGGIYATYIEMAVQGTTVTGNSTQGTGSSGGGIFFVAGEDPADPLPAPITITQSTITENHAAGTGGGVSLDDDTTTIGSTIIASNSDSGANPDLALTVLNVLPTSTTLTNDLIGNNSGTTLTATTGSTPDANGNFIGSAASPINPLLAPLGNYGGTTETMPLLPGSVAIGNGVGGTDIGGAAPSQGFTLSYVSGSNQSALLNTSFAAPLAVVVTSNNPLVPVAGGVVTFAGPATGAGTSAGTTTATIAANGQASVTPTANGTAGAYTVIASAAGSTGRATFNLTNAAPATISGIVFEDDNGNNQFDANELGINGVTIQLQNAAGTVLATTTTANGGLYVFPGQAPGVYRIHEIQPTGVSAGPAQIGSAGGTVINSSTIQLTLSGVNVDNYDFIQEGQQIRCGDSASASFWVSTKGQALITSGGTALAQWLTTNFGNVFGNTFVGGNGATVAAFYKNNLYREAGLLAVLSPDVEFMATALSVYFSSSDLAGTLGVGSGLTVTDTGLGTDTINVGLFGYAFGVSNCSTLSVMQLLEATNSMTDTRNHVAGFDYIYDTNGNDQISLAEALDRVGALAIYGTINEIY